MTGKIATLLISLLAFATVAAEEISAADSASVVDSRVALKELREGIDARWAKVTDREQASETLADYRHLFGNMDDGTSALDNEQLALHFKAAYIAHFHSNASLTLEHLEQLAAVLERRGVMTREQQQWMHSAWIASREFAKANEYRARHPEIDAPRVPELPAGIEPGTTEPIALAVTGKPAEFSAVTLDISDGRHIVIAAHPGCHFTRDAFDAIAEDKALRKILDDAILLARPDGNAHFDAFSEWQSTYPDFPIHPVMPIEPWPIPSWATPTFYFLEDGDVVERVTGWPENGRRDEILAAAERFRKRAN